MKINNTKTLIKLSLRAIDSETKKSIPAWIKLENIDQEKLIIPMDSVPNRHGFPITCKKTIDLPEGHYSITVNKGLSYTAEKQEFELKSNKNLTFELSKRYDLQKNGWFCSECHNHVNFPTDINDVIKFLEAKDIDSVSLCQGWLTSKKSARAHDGEKIRNYIEKSSTKTASLFMGAEFPKTRFGHTCWWRFPHLSDPFSCYDSFHDSSYFKKAGIAEKKYANPADELPYLDEAPIFKIQRWKDQGGVNMMPHPTSWWMDNKKASMICTNIAVDFCFDLLSERLFDTLVVMGYDSEQIFYQNFWFHLLNEGYRIAAAGETDGNISTAGHQIGDHRTYAQIKSKTFDHTKYLKAICKGNSFVTNGPLLFVTADKKHHPGSVITSDNKKHSLNIQIFSSSDPAEYISWVVLYKNGKVEELVDLEDQKIRHWQHDFKVSTKKNERDWYVVKVYGKNRPQKKEFTDIIKYAKSCEQEVHFEYAKLTGTAFSNPFYFEPKGYLEPQAINPPFSGKITDKDTGKQIVGAKVTVSRQCKQIATCTTDEKGTFFFNSIPLTTEIEISCPGYTKKIKSFYLHYEPLKRYFEYIYAGKWALDNKNLLPGQVPWKVFNFQKLQKIVSSIKWDFKLET